MDYSTGLEYIVNVGYSGNSYTRISYFSKNIDDKYEFVRDELPIIEPQYRRKTNPTPYSKIKQQYQTTYATSHLFAPEFFLKPSRPKSRFVVDNSEAKQIAEEAFELMLNQKMPDNISLNILPFNELKSIHSGFGAWNNGILGFSINGSSKQIFVRENNLDALLLVIGHEIGHVLTDSLPNKHDEEAKAFAFSIEWAKTIKQHNIANLGSSIKDELDLQPARNGLHDVAFSFVNSMVKKGRKAINLHEDLVRGYISVFDRVYL